jgi:hypothetical protein
MDHNKEQSMRYKLVTFLLVGFMLSGCAQYQWQKRGATSSELNKDLYKCQTEAANTFPTYMVTGLNNSGLAATATTRCDSYSSKNGSDLRTSNVDCSTTALPTADANADNRNMATDQCMVARGWNLVKTTK